MLRWSEAHDEGRVSFGEIKHVPCARARVRLMQVEVRQKSITSGGVGRGKHGDGGRVLSQSLWNDLIVM